MPPVELTVSAILFDSDGTLVDSTPAVRATISRWCAAQGVNPREFAAAQHGTRAKDLLRRFAAKPKQGSEMSEEELDEAVEELEREVGRTASEMAREGKGGIVMLPGVETLLTGLREGGAAWGIVTSGGSRVPQSTMSRADRHRSPLLTQRLARTPAPLSTQLASARGLRMSPSWSQASSSLTASHTQSRTLLASRVRWPPSIPPLDSE